MDDSNDPSNQPERSEPTPPEAGQPGAGWPPPPSGGFPPPAPPRFGQGQYPPSRGWQPGDRPAPLAGGGGAWSPPAQDPYWTPQPPKRGSVSVAVTAILVAVAVLAGVGIGRSLPNNSSTSVASPSTVPIGGSGGTGLGNTGVGGGTGSGGTGTGSTGAGSNGQGASSGAPADVSSIAAKIDPSLVDIEGTLPYQGELAFGTGIILSSSGLVLTNNHVIDQSTTLRVTDVATQKQYDAKVLGYDELGDVALIQIEGASGLHPATLDTSAVTVGQDVVAVGNAGGKGGIPSSAGGTITALNQAITASDEGDGATEHLTGLIQTNANIMPGDSGGSLVNTKGEVVGMDTAASSTSFYESTGEGFAIPIATALGVIHQVQQGKGSAAIHVGPTAFIGITVASQTCRDSAGASSGPSIQSGQGALICQVVSGTAAAKAGLNAYDAITSIGGHAVTSPSDLTHQLVTFHPGQTTTLGYRSPSGKDMTTNITLGSGPPG